MGEWNVLRGMNACSLVAVYVGLVELQEVVDQVVSRDKRSDSSSTAPVRRMPSQRACEAKDRNPNRICGE